jgi:branched-chain amino acid transport system substrate-binding protein
VAKFKAANVDPEGYVLYTYAAIQTWKQAVEKAKSTDTDKVVKALSEGEFDTVIGKFKFDKKGDPNLPPYAIYNWKGGAYEQL